MDGRAGARLTKWRQAGSGSGEGDDVRGRPADFQFLSVLCDNDNLTGVLTGWERVTGSFRGPAVPERLRANRIPDHESGRQADQSTHDKGRGCAVRLRRSDEGRLVRDSKYRLFETRWRDESVTVVGKSPLRGCPMTLPFTLSLSKGEPDGQYHCWSCIRAERCRLDACRHRKILDHHVFRPDLGMPEVVCHLHAEPGLRR